MKLLRPAVCLALGLVLAGASRCGGSPSRPEGGPDSGPDAGPDAGPDGGPDAGPDGGPDAGAIGVLIYPVNPGGPACTPGPACPEQRPADGGTCAPEALRCYYSADSLLPLSYGCASVAVCANGAWSVFASSGCPVNPAQCPPEPGDAGGAPCSGTGQSCSYRDGTYCTCSNCSGGDVPQCDGPYGLRCKGPDTVPGCPTSAPPDGAPCCPLGISCAAGTFCGGQISGASTCTDGGWVLHPPQSCPN